MQLSCVQQAGRANFNFVLNNGMSRKLGKKGDLDFVDHKFKHSWEENEKKSIVKKIVFQYYTA